MDSLDKLGICPQYLFREIPFIQQVHGLFEDYKRGAVGNVLDLPNDLYEYLKILDYEIQEFDARFSKVINNGT